MTNQPLQAVVFDFDGTLARLTLDFADMTRRLSALASCFLDPAPKKPEELPTLEWLDILACELARQEGEDCGRELHTRGRFMILSMEHEAARRGGLFPRTKEVLDVLRRRGLRLGVITRNSISAVRLVFPDWTEHLDVLLAREDVPLVKPDPDHLLRAVRALEAEPGRTLMVGDHELDILTATRAGCPSAGVASGSRTMEFLAAAGADLVAPDIVALAAELEARGLTPLDADA